jgi:hypothetical protein
MFDVEDLQEDPIALIRYKQIPAPPAKSHKRTIALMMLGGGHFAAIIASLTPKIQANHQSQEERKVDVLASKTFHRYTTRRKQGGAQSANDAAKGNAHSAGSTLRRYNESALQKEIRELLASWKDELDACEFVFIRATGTVNRRTLFGYDGAVLKSNDPRIRGFPFTTRRPVYSVQMLIKDQNRVVAMFQRVGTGQDLAYRSSCYYCEGDAGSDNSRGKATGDGRTERGTTSRHTFSCINNYNSTEENSSVNNLPQRAQPISGFPAPSCLDLFACGHFAPFCVIIIYSVRGFRSIIAWGKSGSHQRSGENPIRSCRRQTNSRPLQTSPSYSWRVKMELGTCMRPEASYRTSGRRARPTRTSGSRKRAS